MARESQARSIKFGNPLVSVRLGSHAWSCCKLVMGTTCITGTAPPGNELLLVTITDFLLRGHYTQVHTHEHTHTDLQVLNLADCYLVDVFLFLLVGSTRGSHRHTCRRLAFTLCVPKDSCAHPVICFHNKRLFSQKAWEENIMDVWTRPHHCILPPPPSSLPPVPVYQLLFGRLIHFKKAF